nr:MAG TPA: hypothetical protein [Caudoviricetes sp.]
MECLSKKLLRNICHTRRHYSEILRLCPDISGYATSGIIWKSAWRTYGALWTEDSGNSDKKSVAPGPDPIVNVRMRAGAYDSTYGRSSSVSVAAAYVLMIIKE